MGSEMCIRDRHQRVRSTCRRAGEAGDVRPDGPRRLQRHGPPDPPVHEGRQEVPGVRAHGYPAVGFTVDFRLFCTQCARALPRRADPIGSSDLHPVRRLGGVPGGTPVGGGVPVTAGDIPLVLLRTGDNSVEAQAHHCEKQDASNKSGSVHRIGLSCSNADWSQVYALPLALWAT